MPRVHGGIIRDRTGSGRRTRLESVIARTSTDQLRQKRNTDEMATSYDNISPDLVWECCRTSSPIPLHRPPLRRIPIPSHTRTFACHAEKGEKDIH